MSSMYANPMGYTSTGFRVTPENDGTPIYFKRLNRAKALLSERGLGPRQAVFIAEDTRTDDEFEPQQKAHRLPAITEVMGEQAGRFLAERSHRLATPEEIVRFRDEQTAREEECDRMEANSPENRKRLKEITTVRETVIMSPDEAQRRGFGPAPVACEPSVAVVAETTVPPTGSGRRGNTNRD
jgi:hypothetical protein